MENAKNHVLGVFIQPVFFAARIIGVHRFFRVFFKNILTFIRGEGPLYSIVKGLIHFAQKAWSLETGLPLVKTEKTDFYGVFTPQKITK